MTKEEIAKMINGLISLNLRDAINLLVCCEQCFNDGLQDNIVELGRSKLVVANKKITIGYLPRFDSKTFHEDHVEFKDLVNEIGEQINNNQMAEIKDVRLKLISRVEYNISEERKRIKRTIESVGDASITDKDSLKTLLTTFNIEYSFGILTKSEISNMANMILKVFSNSIKGESYE